MKVCRKVVAVCCSSSAVGPASCGTASRRRILSLCRTRGAARDACDRFRDLLPRRAGRFGPLRRPYRFQSAAGGAEAPRVGSPRRAHVALGHGFVLSLSAASAPAGGRRGALRGACGGVRGVGSCRRREVVPVSGRGAAATLFRFGALHRPQLSFRGPGRRFRDPRQRMEPFGRRRCPHGPRHARRRGLHQRPDRRTAPRAAFRSGARTRLALHRAALDAGHAPLLLRGGFFADGRPALHPCVGISGRPGPQLPRAARDDPLALVTYGVPLSPATSFTAAFGAEAGISKYSVLDWYDARTPMPDNYRYLPSYAGDRGDRTGVAFEQPALHADRLGRTDPPQPHGRRARGLCVGGPRRTALQPLAERTFHHRSGPAADTPLRGRPPARDDPFLQTDARSAGCGVRHRHRPVPGR